MYGITSFSMQLKSPTELCTPAQLYLGMSLLSTIGFSATSTELLVTIWHLIMNLVWTYFLNFLCDKGHPGISWFLIIFPFLIVLGIMLTLLHIMRKAKSVKTASDDKTSSGSTTTATSAAAAAARRAGATQAEGMVMYGRM